MFQIVGLSRLEGQFTISKHCAHAAHGPRMFGEDFVAPVLPKMTQDVDKPLEKPPNSSLIEVPGSKFQILRRTRTPITEPQKSDVI